jgi:hypothetical protein
LRKCANTAYFVRGSFNAPGTDESAERLADSSVAPDRLLLFFLSVLGVLVAWWLGVEKSARRRPSQACKRF